MSLGPEFGDNRRRPTITHGRRVATGERTTTGRDHDPAIQLQGIVVCAHGWSGKEPTLGFMYSAQTKFEETSKPTVMHALFFKRAFVELLSSLQQAGSVAEFHFYSHSGSQDGPIFADGQFGRGEVRDFPRLGWSTNAVTVFYGCNAGRGWFAPTFAKAQGVTVHGASGFTSFSRQRDKFDPITDPDSTPCYQDSYPGMSNLIVKKYGYRYDNVAVSLWKQLLTLPDWHKARSEHAPPSPMIQYGPDGELVLSETGQ
jgi:hypothetical protein